jgi:hypothetical protein
MKLSNRVFLATIVAVIVLGVTYNQFRAGSGSEFFAPQLTDPSSRTLQVPRSAEEGALAAKRAGALLNSDLLGSNSGLRGLTKGSQPANVESGVDVANFQSRKVRIQSLLERIGSSQGGIDAKIVAIENLERLMPIEVVPELIAMYSSEINTKVKIALARAIVDSFQFPFEKIDNSIDRSLAAKNYQRVASFIESNLKQIASLPDPLLAYFVGTVLPVAPSEIAFSTIKDIPASVLARIDDVELMNALTHLGMRESNSQAAFVGSLINSSEKFSKDAQARLEALLVTSLVEPAQRGLWSKESLPYLSGYLKNRYESVAAGLTSEKPDFSTFSRIFSAWAYAEGLQNGDADLSLAIKTTKLNSALEVSALLVGDSSIIDQLSPEQRQKLLQRIEIAITIETNAKSKMWLERGAQLLKR